MGTFKYSDIELQQLVRKGMTQAEIARQLGVSKASVCVRLQKLNIAISKDVTLCRAGEVVKKELNSLDQLQKINEYANELLDLLMRWNRGDPEALQILESQVRKVKVGRGEAAQEVTEYKFKD